ncbi:MAG: metallophosphoesterase, partial [Clostridia bacterium]|nr:metallophosphoesterase [Clostridia bacterium]
QFVKSDEIVFAHLTDMHYFPLSYAYVGEGENEFTDRVKTSLKLTVESAPYNLAALKQVVEQMPDYMVITGDQTTDGEIQGHVELANLLRQTQNKIRAAGKPNFQIFVVMGNHDMYNSEAFCYNVDGSEFLTPNTTRADIVKIYSSLGFPDLSDAEIEAFYNSKEYIISNLCPYDDAEVTGTTSKGVKYVNSTTAASTSIEWAFDANGQREKLENGIITDYDQGDLTYVANVLKDYVVIGLDDEVSTTETQHHLGGILYQSTMDWLEAKKASADFNGKKLVSLSHHNILPHFEGQDSLLKDFTFYNTFTTADFLADLGVRYHFSGHMHANDIESRVSLNGNLITDTQTASSSGYNGGLRYARIESGMVGDKYAENYVTHIMKTEKVDITNLVELGFVDDDYYAMYDLKQFVEVVDGRTYITNPADYAVNKLFTFIVDSMIGEYVNVEFIGGLGDMLGGILPSSMSGLAAYISPVANNLIRHIEEVVLADYVYQGDKAEFKQNVPGAKLCGYADDLVNRVLNMEVNSEGLGLFDFVIASYLDHIGGRDVAYEDLDAGKKEALKLFQDGTNVKKLLGILLDEQTGLLPIVKGILEPMDLAYGMGDAEVNSLTTILSILVGEVDLHNFKLDDIVEPVLGLVGPLLGFELDLGGNGLGAFIDSLLESYVTESLYTSLGEIAAGIVHSFLVDETAALENSFSGYTIYKSDDRLAASYVEGEIDNTPTAERGMLPSQITVTFGEDPTTDKNFVWFTDKAISGTEIQYSVGDSFDLASATTVTGEFNKYVTTTANIDLGIFATLMHMVVGRHSVSLTDLEPGTTYSYRVGSLANNYWSDVYTFTTAPNGNQPFEVLLISDIQGSAAKPYLAAEAIMANIESVFANGYDFIINCGDVTDNTRNWVQWEYYLAGGLQKYWANTTNVVANGNHDIYSYEKPDEEDLAYEYEWLDKDAIMSNYNYLLMHFAVSYPEQDATTGAYYSFDYSGVHFTVLNTNDLSADSELGEAQVEWLINDLNSTDKEFKVVMMHKSLYSAGSHTVDTDVVAMRKQLSKIFAENGVSLVLAGHDHTYSESYYIDANGEVVENELTGKSEIGKGNGVLYITLGTFGDKYYNFVGNEDVPLEFGEDLHNPTLANPTFGKLVYDGEKLYYIGYEYDMETGKIVEIRGGMDLWEQVAIAGGIAVVTATLCIVLAKLGKGKKK